MTDVSTSTVHCPACKTALPWQMFNAQDRSACPVCGVETMAIVFPALYRPPEKQQAPDSTMIDGEAACFHHPDRKATVACESCGRFLCSLCHVRFGAQNLCPACIEIGAKKNRFQTTANRRVRYDDQAVALALLPLLVFPVTIVTAPIALTIAIWKWKAPMSIFGTSKAKLAFAAILSVLEIAAWATGAVYLYRIYGV
jgi:hypothetical protein